MRFTRLDLLLGLRGLLGNIVQQEAEACVRIDVNLKVV